MVVIAVNYGLSMNICCTPKCYCYLLAYCSTNLWDQRDGTSHDARLHRDIVGCIGRAFPHCGGLGEVWQECKIAKKLLHEFVRSCVHLHQIDRLLGLERFRLGANGLG
eukprot:scaffold35224_cov161-Skeletonema_dohrnii-CCMP3373.AAC.1